MADDDLPAKPLRRDARRNRDQLLAVAAEAFAARGVSASLEQIARDAGVGVGTLYRHFPSREALVAATYRREVEHLCDLADELLAEHMPDEALRAWMDGFVRYAATKKGMGDALKAVLESDSALYDGVRGRIGDALDRLVGAAVQARAIRPDATGQDVLRALGALWVLPAGDEQAGQAQRLLDLLMDGLRHGAG